MAGGGVRIAALVVLAALAAGCGLGAARGGDGGGALGELVGTGAQQEPSSDGFIWPVRGKIVNPYGARFGRIHEGVDIGSKYGTPIHAAIGGKVSYTGWVEGYGNFTLVDVGREGIQTVYSHQSLISVTVGQTVARGQVIGRVGCSGFCVNPNVHFEIRVDGNAVDPLPYLS